MKNFCKFILGDSSEKIKDIPDNSVDLILTDPPYNLGKYSTGNLKMSWRSDFNNDIADWDTLDFKPSDWLDEYKRVLKPDGNLFAFTAYNLLGQWHDAYDSEFDTFQYMIWHKTNPAPKLRKAGFLNSCELIVCCWNKGHTWNFGKQNEMHNFVESSICMGRERLKGKYKHPTQKPVKILEHIIKIASNSGDVVLDTFMGVGSTAVAATNLNRNFIGIELEKKYIEGAITRMNEAGFYEEKNKNNEFNLIDSKLDLFNSKEIVFS